MPIEANCAPHQIEPFGSIGEVPGALHESPFGSTFQVYSESTGSRAQAQLPANMNPGEERPSGSAGAVTNPVSPAADLRGKISKESAEANVADHSDPSIVGDSNDANPPVPKGKVDDAEKTEAESFEKSSRPVNEGQAVIEKDQTQPSSVTPMPTTEPLAVHPETAVDSSTVPTKDSGASSEGSADASTRVSDPLDDLFGDDKSKPSNNAEVEPPVSASGINVEPKADKADEVLKPKSLQEDLFGDEKLSKPSSDLAVPASDGAASADPNPVIGHTSAENDKGVVPVEVKSNQRESAPASIETTGSSEAIALPATPETSSRKINQSSSPAGDASSGKLSDSQDGEDKAPQTQGDSILVPDDVPAKPATDAVKALDDLFGDRSETLDKEAALVSAVEKPEEISIEQSQQRFWRDNTGRFSTSGKVILVSNDFVRLMKDTGKTCTVRIDRLSEVDREYVNAIRQGLDLHESK